VVPARTAIDSFLTRVFKWRNAIEKINDVTRRHMYVDRENM